jgi:ATP-binding cassette subfamily F protein 3
LTTTAGESPYPPPFSSLFFPPEDAEERNKLGETTEDESPPAFTSAPAFTESSSSAAAVAATKAALPSDTKDGSSSKDVDDGEPPPPYSEGSSPLESFTYVMASAGGPASIITQVSQTTNAGPPINTLGGSDENITLELRGTRFTLSRDELLTLPEFVLLSLFPNGLLPDGHMNSYHDGDVYPVDYDPNSLQYMLEFFRTVAQTIPASPPSPTAAPDHAAEAVPIEPMHGSARDMLQDRAGIIVLREDLDFYAIPPHRDITQPEMIEVKRAAGEALLKQDGIFSGLRKSEEPGTTEQHLIEMLTAG